MKFFERFLNKRTEADNLEQPVENTWAELEQMPSFQEMQNKKEQESGKEQIESDEGSVETSVSPEFQGILEAVSSPEEKIKTLSFENMSKLSTEQYVQLWQRLNPFYVTHITRQGVRDHVGMFYHSAGSGELHDGFKNIIRDKKVLRSPAEVRYGISPSFTREDVEKLIDKTVSNEQIKTEDADGIINSLPVNSGLGAADPWADRQAIHFAQHTVLNEYYGGETNNEVFFVFPTDVIASQCKFGGHMHENLFTAQVTNERKWNDIFIWPKDGRIPLDAGLVFLPKNAAVDPGTGSRYATNERGEVEFDEARIGRFTQWMNTLTKDSAELADAENGDFSTVKNKLKEIGIPEEKINDMVLYGGIYSFHNFVDTGTFGNLYLSKEEEARMTFDEKKEKSCRVFLEACNAHLKFAETTINSKEYWEEYFIKHPEEKPAHIIYYSGEASKAVREFLKNNGILEEKTSYAYGGADDQKQVLTGPSDTVERDGDFLGFDKNYIGDGTKDEELNAEHERFNQLAKEILLEKRTES